MGEFHHHPDGIVYLRAGEIVYAASLAEFRNDLAACGLPPYAGLPPGYRERRYSPGAVRALYTADSQHPDTGWTDGDAYLAACAVLAAARALHLAAPAEPE